MSQIKTKFVEADSITDAKIRLRNNNYMRSRNAADSADISILKVNASDIIEFNSFPRKSGTPTNADELVNKSYVDAFTNGLDVKASVRLSSTANFALTGGATLTVDSVSAANGDRVLLKDQSAGAENGIYTVSGIGSAYALTRSTDADVSSEVTAGLFTFVEEGTVNSDSGWVLTTNNPITLGTTALVFAQFSGAGSIVAGTGLLKTGNTIDFQTADTSLTVNADNAQVNVAASGGLEVSSGVKIKRDTVTANTLAITLTANGAGTLYDSNSFTESAESLALAAGVAGAGLALTVGVLSVGVDSVTTKISSDQVVGQSNGKETFTLNGTDITNQYLDMLQVAATSSIHFMVKGSGSLLEGASHDYSVSYTGGAGGKTRITFLNDLATGGNAALVSGDIVQVQYMYL